MAIFPSALRLVAMLHISECFDATEAIIRYLKYIISGIFHSCEQQKIVGPKRSSRLKNYNTFEKRVVLNNNIILSFVCTFVSTTLYVMAAIFICEYVFAYRT